MNTHRTTTAGFCLVVCHLMLVQSSGRAADVEISTAKKDDRGLLVHTVISEYQAGETQIRVLMPDRRQQTDSHAVLYVLPVEAGNASHYGDGLLEIQRQQLHNKHGLICIGPTFSHLPWYADHPTDPDIRQETYLLKVVLPFVEKTYPVLARRLLIGFSKSGWGAWSLLLRHPELFDRAAAWDAPLGMGRPNRYGMEGIFGSQENFEEYRISRLLKQRAGQLQAEPRLALLGYDNFQSHHQVIHGLMLSAEIPHKYRDGPKRAHTWSSGWVPEAVQLLKQPLAASQPPPKHFKITVVDEQTGRGVPLVELRTVNDIRYITDSAGNVAFHEPGLMNQRVFFHVSGHGYEFPKDGFGYRGKTIQITPGGSAELKVKRLNIAERLYRMTGQGIYRDSLLLGLDVPTERPVLNGQVLGSDSVLNVVYRDKIYWFWGDTNRPGYPLGNFHVPGATSLLPDDGGLDPDVGVNLEYFLGKQGFAKETAKLPGDGPTWLAGLVAVGDEPSKQRLFAHYVKVRKFLEIYQRGLVEFDDETKQFNKVLQYDLDAPIIPNGHPFKQTVEGVEYVYYGDPFPLVRVRADAQHIKDPAGYEAYTCLKEGSRRKPLQLDRTADGTLRYGWKRNTPPVEAVWQAQLIKAGHLKPEEALLKLHDAVTGKPVIAHRGTVRFNDYRKRWVMIAVQTGGTSNLGEVWYAEAPTPLGPWARATKIVTHDKYSFYNPKQHVIFDRDGGRTIYFEGTYTATFSGSPRNTPRYDYNQIMYKLDLSDPRLR